MAGSLILPAENLAESKNSKSINRLIKKAGESKYDSAINTLVLTTDKMRSPCAPLIQDLS